MKTYTESNSFILRSRKLFLSIVLFLAISLNAYSQEQNVTFLTAEGGAGHIMIEKAFKDALEKDPSAKDLNIHSIFFNRYLSAKGQSFEKQYVWWAEHAPRLWDAMIAAFPMMMTREMKRRVVRGSFLPELAQEIQKTHPDIIYCTHFSLAEIVDILKEDGLLDPKIKVVSQVTDFSIIKEHNTRGLVVVPHPSLKDDLVKLGKDPAMVQVVGGIPARPPFLEPYKKETERKALVERLASESGGVDHLGTQDPLFLVTGGGDGRNLRFFADFLPHWHPSKPVKVAAICGKNKEMLEQLTRLAQSGKLDKNITLIPRGFETQMHQFMKAADVIICKPGGSTTAEVMALGKPLFVNTSTGIQEERNLKFLKDHNAARDLKFEELNDVDTILQHARSLEASMSEEFPEVKQIPHQLISVFNDYRSGRIPDSPSEAADLQKDIRKRVNWLKSPVAKSERFCGHMTDVLRNQLSK